MLLQRVFYMGTSFNKIVEYTIFSCAALIGQIWPYELLSCCYTYTLQRYWYLTVALVLVPQWHAQYQLYQMRCHYNAINCLQSTRHIFPVRARYGMSFMSANSGLCYVSVTVVLYAILCYTVYFMTTLDCLDIYAKISRGPFLLIGFPGGDRQLWFTTQRVDDAIPNFRLAVSL